MAKSKDTTSATGTLVADGKGNTEGGGGGPDVIHAHLVASPGTNGEVTNQPILALDSNVFEGLTAAQRDKVRTEQLVFAKNVSQASADAYGRILDAVDRTPDKKSDT